VDLAYQHKQGHLLKSPLDTVWKKVEQPMMQWNPSMLKKMSLQRKQAEMSFVHSITQIGERFVNLVDNYKHELMLGFSPASQYMLNEKTLIRLLTQASDPECNSLRTGRYVEMMIEFSKQRSWTQNVNMFFVINDSMMKTLFETLFKYINLPPRLWKFRLILLKEYEKIDNPDIKTRVRSVIYGALWKHIGVRHLCSHFQLMVYVARLVGMSIHVWEMLSLK